jgi:hypothetical protein
MRVRATTLSWTLVTVISFWGLASMAQETKEVSYQVGPKALIAITNNYGPITIKPAFDGHVLVTMASPSQDVTFETEQRGNRVQLRSISRVPGTELAEFTVLAPTDACVTLRSSEGKLHVEGLQGDIVLEAVSGPVEVSGVKHAHVHVRALSGPTTLADIHNSHLDVNSVSGRITLRDVTGSTAVVYSGTGRIAYEGDPGAGGDYRLISHAGDVEVSIPASSPVEIKSRSVSGQAYQGPGAVESAPGTGQKSLLSKLRISGVSVFVVRSFRGKIHITRP